MTASEIASENASVLLFPFGIHLLLPRHYNEPFDQYIICSLWRSAFMLRLRIFQRIHLRSLQLNNHSSLYYYMHVLVIIK